MINLDDERLIDFSGCEERNGGYPGVNGTKKPIIYDGSVYMLKFPALARINTDMHYTNGCVSEYLGCHIYELAGVPVQKTILGKHYKDNKWRLVVACKDFTFIGSNVYEILDFIATKNTVIDSPGSGKGTELSDVLEAIELQTRMDSQYVAERFWDMFVVDAFIGNWDRHNGNWGMIYNKKDDIVIDLAPVFDCGSSLYPQADDKIMESVLRDPAELKLRVYERPLSALMINGKKINYHDFMLSSDNADFLRSVKKIVPLLEMSKVQELIDETPGIDDLHKKFYKTILLNRKNLILDKAYERAKDMVLSDSRDDVKAVSESTTVFNNRHHR